MPIEEFLNRLMPFSLKTLAIVSSGATYMPLVKTIHLAFWFYPGWETNTEGKQRVGLLYRSVGDTEAIFYPGLGLYLQSVAAKLPRRKDLYEDRYIQDLGPYDHLHRLFRVCVIHFFRLIKTCPVPENVRTLMRSLVCMEHGDWDGTIKSICDLGGKPAQGK
jgi:hypothetical protein